MLKTLSLKDIDETVRSKIKSRNYSFKQIIQGVKIVTLQNHAEEDGDFCEVAQFTPQNTLESFPEYKVAQINRTKHHSEAIKAWHLQLKQDMVWYVSPSDHLFVGLWDVRKNSKTKGVTMRIILGDGFSKLLFIPRGVVHGSANFLKTPVNLYYFTNRRFNIKDPDEKRLPWDILGSDFWIPSKD